MNNFKKITAVLSAAVLAAAFTTGCSDEDSSSSNSSNANIVYYDNSSNSYQDPQDEDKEARKNAVVVTGKIDEKTEVQGCEIIITRVVKVGERVADQMYDYDADLIAAKVQITNNNKETIKANGMGDFTVSVDGAKEVSGMDLNASTRAPKVLDDYINIQEDVESGKSVEGYINFEAKKGWKSIEVKYTPKTEVKSFDAVTYTITPDMVEEIEE